MSEPTSKATNDLLRDVYNHILEDYKPVVTVIQIGVPEATTVVYNLDGGATSYVQPLYCRTFFIADDDYIIKSMSLVQENAQTSADGNSLMVSKLTGTDTAAGATVHLIEDTAFEGGDNTLKGFDIKGIVAETVTGATMTNQASSLALTAGDRLCYGINGTLSSSIVTVQVNLQRVL